jgi:hypothetical protein
VIYFWPDPDSVCEIQEGLVLFLFYGREFRAVFSFAEWFETEFHLLLQSLILGTEFRAFFSSSEWFGTEFREFCILLNSWNSVGINQLFRLFRLPQNKFFVGNCQP